MAKPKIAVVGGGIFGVTTAVVLAQHGYPVDLFEKNDELLTAASCVNQYRLHRGYHYPRSRNTVLGCIQSEPQFCQMYGPAVVSEGDHFYGIARSGSLISAERFLAVLDSVGLNYTPVWDPVLKKDEFEICLKVTERLYDVEVLRALCWEKLKAARVNVHLGKVAVPSMLAPYARVILASYASLNQLIENFPEQQQAYQFELCEKPVVALPESYRGKSVVVMDGPFMCVDPCGHTGNFVLGHVQHAIHHVNIGRFPVIPEDFRPWLNRGIIAQPPHSHYELFTQTAQKFFVGFDAARYLGSMFTICTVLPDTDTTDERPTLVRTVGERFITVFSDKVPTCVQAAEEVLALVRVGHQG